MYCKLNYDIMEIISSRLELVFWAITVAAS
jgi:hypothetical protein